MSSVELSVDRTDLYRRETPVERDPETNFKAQFAASVLDDLERQGVSEQDIRTALGWRAEFREVYDEPWPGFRGEHVTGSFVKVDPAAHDRIVNGGVDRVENPAAEEQAEKSSGATGKAPLTGVHATYLEKHPDREERIRANRDGNALDLAMSRDVDEQGEESAAWYREWHAAERAEDAAPQGASALADYRPGSALASVVSGYDRDGVER